MTFHDWRNCFDNIFKDYPDRWRLSYVHRNDLNRIKALECSDRFSREKSACFSCKRCGNSWPSSKAQVLLYYPKRDQPLGKVTMQVFGQQCRRCPPNNRPYVDPFFAPEKITKILEQFHEQIGTRFYNKFKPKPNQKKPAQDDQYTITGEHESRLCEACRRGICSYQRQTVNNRF